VRHVCWHCSAANVSAGGRCRECGQPIEPPVGTGYVEQLLWALRHPLPGTQMIAAQILGQRREAAAAGPLRALVDGPDPYLAAQALQSLVAVVGAAELGELLVELARSGPPPVASVAARALRDSADL
jgi:hypothetical protein